MWPVKRSKRRVAGLSIALALSAVACVGSDSPTADRESAVALPATATELPTFDLARFRKLLGQLKGAPVVVNVWASWCRECIQEAPDLAEAAREYEGKVRFLGIDIQDRPSAARTFIRRFGWPYPSVLDPTGAIRNDLGIAGQPNTILFDASGKQTFVWRGAISLELLRPELAKVLAEQ
jgi:cytochrome c biogenesis protein CcmG/thiol:disulfide interchange protein DsbE